jgi:DNA-binding MarR family transcriptional regulator
MSDGLASHYRTFETHTYLGLGIAVVIIGLLLRFVSPIEVFVELWLISVTGTVILGLGFLIVVVGLVRFLANKDLIHPSNKEEKHISQKEFEKKYSEASLTNSSANAKTVETMAKERNPLNRKEIAEKTGLSNTHASHVLKSFVKNGYVLEFKVRDTFYYVLADKGLRFSEDIKAVAKNQESIQFEPAQHKLREAWLQRKLPEPKFPNHGGRPMNGLHELTLDKQRILRQQLVLAFGFLGGLFTHFMVGFETLLEATRMSAIPFLIVLTVIVCLASTILGARRVAGSLGVLALALAWISGFIVVRGDPLMSVGVTLLMGSTAIGAFAVLYS